MNLEKNGQFSGEGAKPWNLQINRAGPAAIKERGLVHAKLPILSVSPKVACLSGRWPVRKEHRAERKGDSRVLKSSLAGW